MQRGEGMAPVIQGVRNAEVRRWIDESHILLLGERYANSVDIKNNRDDSDSDGPGRSRPDGPPFGKVKIGGNSKRNSGSNGRLKKNGGRGRDSNNSGGGGGISGGGGSGSGSDSNGNGNGNRDDSNNRNGNNGGSDSNGAQRLPPDSIGPTTSPDATALSKTSTSTPDAATATSASSTTPSTATTSSADAAAVTTPTTLVPTSTIINGSENVVTTFSPLVGTPAPAYTSTLADASITTASLSTSVGLSASTDSDISDDRKHKDPEDSSRSFPISNGGGRNSTRIPGPKGLSPTAERVLISTGSIGSFIVICFIAWIVWRTMKKRKQRRNGDVSSSSSTVVTPEMDRGNASPRVDAGRLPGRIYDRVASRVPFLSIRRKTWQTLEDDNRTDVAADQARTMIPTGQAQVHIGKMHLVVIGTGTAPPVLQPQADYTSGVGLGIQPHHFDASAQHGVANDRSSGTDTRAVRSRIPDSFFNQSELARQPSDAYDPTRRQAHRASELSSLSSGFGDGSDMLVPLTQQLQMGHISLSQQQQKQQQQQQQHNRISGPAPPKAQLGGSSRIASQPMSQPPSQTPPPPHPVLPGLPRSFSWVRNNRVSRETVYTESSEDQPDRFRTVDSWVKQQIGHVRRAQEREDSISEETQTTMDLTQQGSRGSIVDRRGLSIGEISDYGKVPPGIVHPMPAEPRLSMMADDGEEPRRPETVPAIQMMAAGQSL